MRRAALSTLAIWAGPAQVIYFGALINGVALPAIAARLTELGAEPRTEGPDAFRNWLGRETDTYTKLIRDNNVRLD